MLWEEYPGYQKTQARLIGFLLLLVLIVCVSVLLLNRMWELLGGLLLFLGAVLLAVAILVGGAWLLVPRFTRRLGRDTQEDNQDV